MMGVSFTWADDPKYTRGRAVSFGREINRSFRRIYKLLNNREVTYIINTIILNMKNMH